MTDIERLRKDIDQHKKMSFENAQKATEWAGCTQLEIALAIREVGEAIRKALEKTTGKKWEGGPL
jgi:hypothetical protein